MYGLASRGDISSRQGGRLDDFLRTANLGFADADFHDAADKKAGHVRSRDAVGLRACQGGGKARAGRRSGSGGAAGAPGWGGSSAGEEFGAIKKELGEAATPFERTPRRAVAEV